MSADSVMSVIEQGMEKSVSHLQKEFRITRTGRATPALVESVRVNAYGAEIPLKQCATISVPEARQLMLKPYDLGLLKEIEKALLASDLGVTPQNDGKIIRLSFPPLTGERRKKLAQGVKSQGEDAKVTVRNVRRDGLKMLDDMEKKKELSQDDVKKLKDDVQNQVKKYEKIIDGEVDKKIGEIMEI
ncbi:MAG: ribosome recycling factor [Planctomycetota bacterium]|jgi:ribosome recycling factor|nr:ribosome recycling factor [Planctomycetota bacterium]